MESNLSVWCHVLLVSRAAEPKLRSYNCGRGATFQTGVGFTTSAGPKRTVSDLRWRKECPQFSDMQLMSTVALSMGNWKHKTDDLPPRWRPALIYCLPLPPRRQVRGQELHVGDNNNNKTSCLFFFSADNTWIMHAVSQVWHGWIFKVVSMKSK